MDAITWELNNGLHLSVQAGAVVCFRPLPLWWYIPRPAVPSQRPFLLTRSELRGISSSSSLANPRRTVCKRCSTVAPKTRSMWVPSRPILMPL